MSKYYMDKGKSTYITDDNFKDFAAVDWDECCGINTQLKKESTLVYFDDHQSGYRRMIEGKCI